MKLLIVLQNCEGSAPGIIYKRIINMLCKQNDIDILYSGKLDANSLPCCEKKIRVPYLKLPIRVKFFFQKYFFINPSDYIWGWIAPLFTKGHYDVVFNMISMSSYAPLYASYKICRHVGAKYATFSVDAIPAPGWSYDKRIIKAQKNAISLLKHVDYFASINPWMLNYQLTTFKHKSHLKSGVIYLPVEDSKLNLPLPTNNEDIVFLYAGRIYADRKIDYMMEAFSLFLKNHNNAKFVFVGASLSEAEIKRKFPDVITHIEIHGYTSDLLPYYARATVLVDIDASIENDVFLSSKLLRYLTINRLILCETGLNSPSKHMFAGIPSIIQCEHSCESVLQGMEKTVSISEADFSDRNEVIEKYSIQNIVENIQKDFNTLIKYED